MSSEDVPSEILHNFERSEDSYVEEGYDEAESGEDGNKPSQMNNSVRFTQFCTKRSVTHYCWLKLKVYNKDVDRNLAL